MSAGNHKTYGHSAIVRMELCVNGHVLPIAQIGPNFLVLHRAGEYGRQNGLALGDELGAGVHGSRPAADEP